MTHEGEDWLVVNYEQGDTVRIIRIVDDWYLWLHLTCPPRKLPADYDKLVWTVTGLSVIPHHVWIWCAEDGRERRMHKRHLAHTTVLEMLSEVGL